MGWSCAFRESLLMIHSLAEDMRKQSSQPYMLEVGRELGIHDRNQWPMAYYLTAQLAEKVVAESCV